MYPSIPHEDHSEPAPDMAGAEPGEPTPPSPSPGRTTPASTPSPVSRPQRNRKLNSLLNPETWDLSSTEQMNRKGTSERPRRRRGKNHS